MEKFEKKPIQRRNINDFVVQQIKDFNRHPVKTTIEATKMAVDAYGVFLENTAESLEMLFIKKEEKNKK